MGGWRVEANTVRRFPDRWCSVGEGGFLLNVVAVRGEGVEMIAKKSDHGI